MNKLQKVMFYLFAVLIFFVPLILWPFTSEVFEFNKMVLVYILTALISGTWLIRMIVERKFIFRRTILDIPLLIFLGSQLISTILSIDPLTSWLGYYSRFNGGLVSTVCYSLLYWAWVSNFEAKETLKLIYVWLASGTFVAIYAVLEHFGIDKNIWVQDVQSRVFSTLGQPNWLAAWLVALMPVTWAFIIESGGSNFESRSNSKFHDQRSQSFPDSRFLIYFALSVLFFWAFIFTKSRSGYLGFGVAAIIFWGLTAWNEKKEIKKLISPVAVIGGSILLICLISGTQFTPSVFSLINHSSNQQSVTVAGSTALETGGTESGTIRKIVWKGAIQIWIHYPIFGTGLETFPFTYYKYRPAEHNLVSEWDYIYPKAHNEFLNFAANSGTIGLLSYLALMIYVIIIFIKTKNFALLAGFASLAATNFFGFSVVPTQLQFFLFPAIALALTKQSERVEEYKIKKLENTQKIGVFLSCSLALILLYSIARYWYADTLYAKGHAYNSVNRPDIAVNFLTRAISLTPSQPLFHMELANSYKALALSFYQQKDTDNTKKFTDFTLTEANTATTESPANVNLKRSLFGVYITLSAINPNYLLNAESTLMDAIALAPTDAKLYYNLGLTYARIGQLQPALTTLKKTVELKADYKEARLAYAILLIDNKQNTEAKAQLNYILTNIDPNDSLTKQTLAGIK